MKKIVGSLGTILTVFLVSFSHAETFNTASLAENFSSGDRSYSCPDKTVKVWGKIDHKTTMKSGGLGFHHCAHKSLRSRDFPEHLSSRPGCVQLSGEPEAVAIYPPLPHSNTPVLTFDRENPSFVPDGTTCSVSYTQYYYHP